MICIINHNNFSIMCPWSQISLERVQVLMFLTFRYIKPMLLISLYVSRFFWPFELFGDVFDLLNKYTVLLNVLHHTPQQFFNNVPKAQVIQTHEFLFSNKCVDPEFFCSHFKVNKRSSISPNIPKGHVCPLTSKKGQIHQVTLGKVKYVQVIINTSNRYKGKILQTTHWQ